MSVAIIRLARFIPAHSHVFSRLFYLRIYLFPFTVSCKFAFLKPEDLEMWSKHLSFRFLTMDSRLEYVSPAAWAFLRTSLLATLDQ